MHVHRHPPCGEQCQRHPDHRRGAAFDAGHVELAQRQLDVASVLVAETHGETFRAAGLHDQKQTGAGGVGYFAAGFAGGEFLNGRGGQLGHLDSLSGVNMG